jgi:Carboxypeptidase regulatory-like domain
MKVTQILLLIVLTGGWLLAGRVSAQSIAPASTTTGSIRGTVVDVDGDPVPNATVVLQAPAANPLTVVTQDDGTFAFHEVTPGTAYEITVAAEGFARWNSSTTVEPGQDKHLSDIPLRIAAVERAVTVGYSSKEVAVQQFQAEEQQRVLGFIPNMYVTYEAHPEPLTTNMKFRLLYKSLTHPTFFSMEATWAGIQQAANTPNWSQGAEGYGKRLGASLAGGSSEMLFSNAILPSLLHQDPRYFYEGTGTKWSRAAHAILAPFICKGDNGASQPNYSQIGGALISASLANTYYPESNRGAGLVFKSFGTDMGIHVALGLAQEFLLAKFTSRGKHSEQLNANQEQFSTSQRKNARSE